MQSEHGSHETLKSVLLVATLFLAAMLLFSLGSNPAIASSQIYPAKGTWKGTLSGNGTAGGSPITIYANANGTFDGDTSHGLWIGTYVAKYEVLLVNIKGQFVAEIKGEYNMKIDDSGVISGDGTAQVTGVTGVPMGEMKLKIQGTEAKSGDLKGTFSGTVTITQFDDQQAKRHVTGVIKAPVSGDFEGKEQRPGPTESPTPTLTPTPPGMPTQNPQTTTTPTPTAAPTTTQPNLDTNTLVMLATVIVVVLAVATVFAKKRRKGAR
jgi:hypothetical protein